MNANFKEQLLKILGRSSFQKVLQLDVVDLHEGEVVLCLTVRDEITNPWKTAHGGVLATLADTSMAVACSSLDKNVLTLNLNINYISDAKMGETVKAFARVLHNGRSTMVAESELKVNDTLIATARGTFFVIGQVDENLIAGLLDEK